MSKYLICGDDEWKDDTYIKKYLKTLPKNVIIYHGGHNTGVERWLSFHGTVLNLSLCNLKVVYDSTDRKRSAYRLLQMCKTVKPDKIIIFHNDIELMDELNISLRTIAKQGYEIVVIKNKYYT